MEAVYVMGCDFTEECDHATIVVGKMEGGILTIVDMESIRESDVEDRFTEYEAAKKRLAREHNVEKIFKAHSSLHIRSTREKAAIDKSSMGPNTEATC